MNSRIVVEDVDIAAVWTEPKASLVDKMISWECGTHPPTSDEYGKFWQELIDREICWSSELPRHYARTAAQMLRWKKCFLFGPNPAIPDGWDKSDFLREPLRLGYDDWDRPPMHEDWGRPFRWKQVRKEQIRVFKQNTKRFKETGDLPEEKGCCKGGAK